MRKQLLAVSMALVLAVSFSGCRSMAKRRAKKNFFKQLTIKHLDGNKDGLVSCLEFSVNFTSKRFSADALFVRIDTNGDQVLTANELDAMVNKLKAMQN